jgi:uncharacterized membrane protein
MSAMLILLPWLVKLDGKPHADWQQFLGRFHPLAVHLPIGLLVLLPLLEITGAFRPALREAAGFVLGLAFAACLLALTLGFLLAYGGGDAGFLVSRHMAGGIALTIGVLLCLLARPWWSSGSVAYAYPALLICTLLALVWTADQGGSITHGSNYLTQYMPSGLKRIALLGASTPPATSFYAKRINPILDANCVSCHGEAKAQAGLRMDSYALLMQGGKDGPVIVAGNAEKSLLLQRVTLPPDHKQFMPAEGKPPLRAEEIAWIKGWIQQGASPTAATVAGLSIIVEAELGRTAVTNASFDTLKQFAHLRALHMEGTHITGDGLAKLAPLSQLTYINLSGTLVTPPSVAPLSAMKNLRHVYLYNTPAQPAPAAEQASPVARNTP